MPILLIETKELRTRRWEDEPASEPSEKGLGLPKARPSSSQAFSLPTNANPGLSTGRIQPVTLCWSALSNFQWLIGTGTGHLLAISRTHQPLGPIPAHA